MLRVSQGGPVEGVEGEPKRQKKPEEYHTPGKWEGFGVAQARNWWIQGNFIPECKETKGPPAHTWGTGSKNY